MISRYSRKETEKVWSEQNLWDARLKVEILASKAWAELGIIPKEDVKLIEQKATFSVSRIKELEQVTKHDIVAFTRNVSESLGPEKKWVHYGLTSTDVVDTAQGYILKQVNDIIEADILSFMEILKSHALKYKGTYCIGRTHGIHADITTFGLKFALYYDEMQRNLTRFRQARKDVEVGKLSGAVGNFSNIPMFVEEYVCDKLGISHAKVSTQVVQRDNHAFYMSTLALIGTSLEKMALEIRGLQRTEVNEVQEYFSKGQKGSSAMPHKRNPIGSENICGCSRVLRGYMMSAFEDVPLWHERDISHSCVERIILPDATMLLDYMLNRFSKIVDKLIVHEDNMLKNIYLTNKVIFAQRVMNALIGKGLSREEAYDIVQPIALNAYDNSLDYEKLLSQTKTISTILSKEELHNCFTLEYYLKNVENIYKRLGFKI